MSYFSSIGYQCPTNKNPADYFMSLLSSDTYKQFRRSDLSYSDFIEGLSQQYANSSKFIKVELDPNMPELTNKFVHERKYKAGLWTQFVILLGRGVLNCARLLKDDIMSLISDIIIALLMMTLFYDVTLILI